MKKLVVFTGAGISAESGIRTFRDSGGLWEEHRIEDVASPEGWARNPGLVLDFYNKRRRQARECVPNEGHRAIAALESDFDVTVITQNVDDLHERAGSTKVIHLHGELLKARSTADERLVYDWKADLNKGDTCELGSQLRPHIVWFGEDVPAIEEAANIAMQCDVFIVVGSSLVVFPAAGLIRFAPHAVPKFVIDPNAPEVYGVRNLTYLYETATTGVPKLAETLRTNYR